MTGKRTYFPINGTGTKCPYEKKKKKKKKKLHPKAKKSIKNLNVKGKTIGLIILVTKRLLKQDTICISLKGTD